MSKPITAVAFRDDAPLDGLDGFLKWMRVKEGSIRYMDCAEVAETSFGFLRLVPSDGLANGEFGIYVPPAYVQWMIRSTAENRPGFL